MAKRSNGETLRRLRFGALLKLFQRNRRALLPDNDLGRAQLYELLLSSSPAKMVDTVAMYATWMPATEAEQLIDQVNRLPPRIRFPKSRVVGERWRVTNAERELWRLWSRIFCMIVLAGVRRVRSSVSSILSASH